MSEGRIFLLVLGGGGALVAGIACLALSVVVGVKASQLSEDEPAEPPSPIGGPIDPLGGPPPLPPPAMRDRYRPGPYVSVEGLLPSGRLEVRRMDVGPRTGRTIETPWVVAGAELRPGAAPSSAGDGAPLVHHADAGDVLTIVAGVPTALPIRTDSGAGENGDVSGLYLAFHDYPGHFFLPATVDTELGHVQVAGVERADVLIGLDAPVRPDRQPITGAPYDVVAYVAAVDLDGRVSPYVTRTLRVMPVGAGDVEVTLTMSAATDLDLYVVDPAGTTSYYGNTESASGGHLDLDANAACSSNLGVNTEHVYWPAGGAPAGTYTVRVANFETCIGGARVDYRVTVRACGETAVFAGSFDGEGNTESCLSPPGERREWCQQVVEFDVPPCSPSGGAVPSGPT